MTRHQTSYNNELFGDQLSNLQAASGDTSPISWNFAKFLVKKDGTVFGRYSALKGSLTFEHASALFLHVDFDPCTAS